MVEYESRIVKNEIYDVVGRVSEEEYKRLLR